MHEELWLGVALTGQRAARAWHASRERIDLYDAKGMAELVLANAGVAGAVTEPWPAGEEPGYLEPGRAARLVVDGLEIARFGEVAHRVREVFDLARPGLRGGGLAVRAGGAGARRAALRPAAALPRRAA
jgi:phenylalanyl-tRNA synthetase beta chain